MNRVTMVLRPALFFLSFLLPMSSVEPFFFNIPWLNPDGYNMPNQDAWFNLFQPPENDQPFVAPPETNDAPDGGYSGEWELVNKNAGVSAMHMILMPHNKAIMFDTFVYGPSQKRLPANVECRKDPKGLDCWAHAVEFDIKTYDTRPLKMLTDPWCSAGGLAPDGTLVNSGGWFDGTISVRYLGMCDTCDWEEHPKALAPGQRWYSTQQTLPGGGMVVIGGRRAFSYEFVPPRGQSNTKTFKLDFLRKTTDPAENNLYPFVHLVPDGNLFIFANHRAILLNPTTGRIVSKYPNLLGGSRNYPASGMSALLPLDLRSETLTAQVLICGGALPEGMSQAAKNNFLPALKSCGRITITDPNPTWVMEDMPLARVMGDMLLLPNSDVLMLNGASRGVSGWWFARDPVLQPVLYKPNAGPGERFRILTGTDIPRVYHSSSVVLPDATILVAGSNTNNAYNFTNVLFPTELRVEKFRPPYLDPKLAYRRPIIDRSTVGETMGYGKRFQMEFNVVLAVEKDVMVTMYPPPFTTHGFSQGQRLIILRTEELNVDGIGRYQIAVDTPPSAAVAPPGYYLLFVVNGGVPSEGVWVRIQ